MAKLAPVLVLLLTLAPLVPAADADGARTRVLTLAAPPGHTWVAAVFTLEPDSPGVAGMDRVELSVYLDVPRDALAAFEASPVLADGGMLPFQPSVSMGPGALHTVMSMPRPERYFLLAAAEGDVSPTLRVVARGASVAGSGTLVPAASGDGATLGLFMRDGSAPAAARNVDVEEEEGDALAGGVTTSHRLRIHVAQPGSGLHYVSAMAPSDVAMGTWRGEVRLGDARAEGEGASRAAVLRLSYASVTATGPGDGAALDLGVEHDADASSRVYVDAVYVPWDPSALGIRFPALLRADDAGWAGSLAEP